MGSKEADITHSIHMCLSAYHISALDVDLLLLSTENLLFSIFQMRKGGSKRLINFTKVTVLSDLYGILTLTFLTMMTVVFLLWSIKRIGSDVLPWHIFAMFCHKFHLIAWSSFWTTMIMTITRTLITSTLMIFHGL
jgi:hypothetical protein